MGQKVVVVRCEGLVMTGSKLRNKQKFMRYLNKRMNTKPSRGPFHFRAPSRMFYRALRGMIPHKTPRGAAALERVKVFEGIPAPYDSMKRMVVPSALKVLRLAPRRKVTNIGVLASEVGWKYADVIQTLEAARKEKSKAFYQEKLAKANTRRKAIQGNAQAAELTQTLASLGY